jgi:ribosome-associated toxin RatA of RatAB toxin-antitoxin module|tara:strand:- start:802 stop:1251 length:450 start_codon:yes stop_codon:yes gene_type:complete
MSNLQFSINLTASSDEFLKLVTDYKNLPVYMPKQLQNLEIIEQNNGETITEETFFLKTLKISITQQTIHKKISENQLSWEIITGPVKGTKVILSFENSESGTIVSVDTDLKLELKLKIFSPIIQKQYKKTLTGILYKMNSDILYKINKV